MMPTGRYTWRTWVFVGLAVFLLFALWVPNTSIPSKSKEYIGKAWNHVTGSQPKEDEPYVPVQMDGAPANETGFNFDKWYFQFDLEFPQPTFNGKKEKLTQLAPHNYRGPGHEVFATLCATRNPSLQDPYFMAMQQVIYRTLWDPRSRSKKHPFIVFVLPYVTQEQRDMFTAAGAIVREVDYVPFHPKQSEPGKGVSGRLIDMFSKLEMWKATDFSRITYLDGDAFPIENIDNIFSPEVAPMMRCKPDLVDGADLEHGADMCNYVFAGHVEITGMLNAGVMVFNPNLAMHDMFMRVMRDENERLDQGFAEQSLLNYVFRDDGPFPRTKFEEKWNGFPDVKENGGELYVAHGKLWTPGVVKEHWAYSAFEDTWNDMRALYDSEEFLRMREEDERIFNEIA